ncbi:hypothetical protein GC176_12665 [bacterium]|nr:hypothetical protein [bacterium]
MGHWGLQPWENDGAADWLDQFAEQSRLSERIENGLRLPLEQIDEIRATAYLLLKFSEAGAWLLDEPESLTELAIDRLSEAVESGLYTNPAMADIVLAELVSLRLLLAKQSGEPDRPDPVLAELTRVASEFGLAQYNVVEVEGSLMETRPRDVVGTGFLDDDGVLHLQLEDGRPNGFLLKCRCVPDDGSQSE